MPIVSENQRRAMEAAAHGHSTLGIPKAVAEKYLAHDFNSLVTSPNSAIPSGLRKQAADAMAGLDMSEEDWRGIIEGLIKFFGEEANEPAHIAGDSALTLALDRDSVREKDRDGRLRVATTNISKANVCPYRGKEIPGWQKLGLEPDRIYNLLRHPDELRKAAPSLNGVPLLRNHVPVNADDHRPSEVIGSLGTDADFDGTYLKNSLFVNAQDAIDGIESGKKRELSAGYHYTPDMTAGNFNGNAFDGVMRDIVFNHVALVEDGRAGPDVVVGDSTENLNMKPTRYAAVVLAATAAHVAPLLAMDSKVTLSTDLFKKLTPKNLKDSKAGLLAGVRSAVDGKLKPGIALDASMAGLAKAIDAFENLEGEQDENMEENASVMPAPAVAPESNGGTYDAEPMKAFLREKGMGEDDITKVCDMLPKSGVAGDEDDEEAKKKKAEEEEAAKKKTAEDNEMKEKEGKQAMDAAIKVAVDGAEKRIRENERGIRTALAEVHPWTGDIPASMAFDSAADVHRHALKMLNVTGADKLHADALLPILKSQPRPGSKPARRDGDAPLAMDATVVDKATKIAPGLAMIQNVV